MTSSEKHLVQSAQMGDRTAFDHLYDVHHDHIYGVVTRRSIRRADVDDLVQDTFVKAWRGIGTFRCDSAFSTWITRIALNVCFSHRRSVQVRRTELVPHEWFDLPGGLDLGQPSTSPEEQAHWNRCAASVSEGICDLPDGMREAVRMRFEEDLPYDDIALALDHPIGTVKTWIHRGRRRLRERFAQG